MDFYLISPIEHLEYVGDYRMVIAPWVKKYKKYRDWARGYCEYKILDNGSFEGEPVGMDELLGIADNINADEVVAPDTTSMLHLVDAQERIRNMGFDVMGVAMGKSLAEICANVEDISEICDVVGLPHRYFKWPETRVQVVKEYPGVEFHQLGCADPDSVTRDARSLDTSWPWKNLKGEAVFDPKWEFENPEKVGDIVALLFGDEEFQIQLGGDDG